MNFSKSNKQNNNKNIDSNRLKRYGNLKSIIISESDEHDDKLISVYVSSPTNTCQHVNTLKRSIKIPKSFKKNESKNLMSAGVGKSVRRNSVSKSKLIKRKSHTQPKSNKAPTNQTEPPTKADNKCSIFYDTNLPSKVHYGISCKLKVNLETNDNGKQKDGAVFTVKQFEQGNKTLLNNLARKLYFS